MKKVAVFFNGRSNLGGAERRLARIMDLITKKNIEVTFLFKLFEDYSRVVESYTSIVGKNSAIKWIGFENGIDIYKFVIKERFDAVFYTDAYRDMIPFFLGAKVAGSMLVMLQVTTGPSIGVFSSLINKILFGYIARNSTRIDCLYPSTTNRFKNLYKKQIVTTTPCPSTDLDLFKPGEKKKELAFIGRWVEGKNVELFVKSMIEVQDTLHEQGYCVMLCGSRGSGPIDNKVQELIKTAKYPEMFKLPGYVQSQSILPSAAVFYSLQNINNYPSQSLIEAIACGCFIIASDEGDTSSIVKESFGHLCTLDVESIKKCTLDYINRAEELKDDVKTHAVEFACKNFAIVKSVDHYFSMIMEPSTYGK